MLAGGAEAVQGDHPGGAGAGHEPRGQGAEFAGDLDVLLGEPEGADRGAPVQLRGEPDAGAGSEDAELDPLQAADNGVGGVRDPVEDGAEDGVQAGGLHPVRAGAQRGDALRVRVIRSGPVACTVSLGSPGSGRPDGALRATSLAYRPAAITAAPTPIRVVTAAAVAVAGRTLPVSAGRGGAATGRTRTDPVVPRRDPDPSACGDEPEGSPGE
ncbi:hypothetical protein SALBM217S_07428 [Streptomyces griseoloalbus]